MPGDVNVAELKGKDLDNALTAAGLSTSGQVGAKRDRLAAHLADPPAAGLTTSSVTPTGEPIEVPEDGIFDWLDESENDEQLAARIAAVRAAVADRIPDEDARALFLANLSGEYPGIGEDERVDDSADEGDPVEAATVALAPGDGEAIYIVLKAITGTRNGAAWPAPGQPISLTPGEAEDYVRSGTVALPLDEPERR